MAASTASSLNPRRTRSRAVAAPPPRRATIVAARPCSASSSASAGRRSARLVGAKLAAQGTKRRPLEGAARREPGADGHLQRNRAPGGAVELDAYVAPRAAERRDDDHRPLLPVPLRRRLHDL